MAIYFYLLKLCAYVQPVHNSDPEDESFIDLVEDLMEKVQDAERSKDAVILYAYKTSKFHVYFVYSIPH